MPSRTQVIISGGAAGLLIGYFMLVSKPDEPPSQPIKSPLATPAVSSAHVATQVLAQASAPAAPVAVEEKADPELEKRRAEFREEAQMYYRRAVNEVWLSRKFEYLIHAFLRIRNNPQEAHLFETTPEQLVTLIRETAWNTYEYDRDHPVADPVENYIRLSRMQAALHYIGMQPDGANDMSEVVLRTRVAPEMIEAERATLSHVAAGPALSQLKELEVATDGFVHWGNQNKEQLNHYNKLVSLLASNVTAAVPYGKGMTATEIYDFAVRAGERLNDYIGKRNKSPSTEAAASAPRP